MEQNSVEKKLETENCGDRISNMPENLVDSIVSRLPLPDAVRTSVLSKSWENHWKRTPMLTFDQAFFETCIHGKDFELGTVVNSVISHHDAPVREFSLYVPSQVQTLDPLEVILWIRWLSENGIEVLAIRTGRRSRTRLPSHLFKCSHLKKLELQNCTVQTPNEFTGFANLVDLLLETVFIDSNLLQTMISTSPHLESLNVLSGNNDESFIMVDAPKLKTLIYGPFFRPLWLKKSPYLTRASISAPVASHVGETLSLDQLVRLMPQVEMLSLGVLALSSLTAAKFSKALAVKFINLRELVLSAHNDYDFIKLMFCALCVVKSSPNLKYLELNTDEDTPPVVLEEDGRARLQLMETELQEGISVPELCFGNLVGSDYEIAFLTTVIKNCKMLHTAHFYSFHGIVSEDEVKMTEALQALRPPSVLFEFYPTDENEDQFEDSTSGSEDEEPTSSEGSL